MFSLVACQAQCFEIVEAVGFRTFLVMHMQVLSRTAAHTLVVIPHPCPQLEFRKFKRFIA